MVEGAGPGGPREYCAHLQGEDWLRFLFPAVCSPESCQKRAERMKGGVATIGARAEFKAIADAGMKIKVAAMQESSIPSLEPFWMPMEAPGKHS